MSETLTPFDEGYLAHEAGYGLDTPHRWLGVETAAEWERGWRCARAVNEAAEASIGGAAPTEGTNNG